MKSYAPKQEAGQNSGSKGTTSTSGGGGSDQAIRSHTDTGLTIPAQLKNLVGDNLQQAVQMVERHTQSGKDAGLQGPTMEAHEEAVGEWRLLQAQIEKAMEATEKAVTNQQVVLAPLFEQADATAAHLNGYPTTVGALREG